MKESILRTGAAAPAMITQINGQQFVSGLFWQPLSRPRAFMKEAREIGKREGMDIVAIRQGTIMQAGFVAKNQGAMKGMYSMAAALAGVLGKSWVGVFHLSAETYAMVAVQDGAILPGCDLVGTRQAVEEKLRVTYNLFPRQWEKVYCPADFNFGGEEISIDKILVPGLLSKSYRLKQLTFGMTGRELVVAVILLTLLVAASVGYLQWKKQREKRAIAEKIRLDQQRKQELAKLNANARKPQQEQALDHPWSRQPGVEEFARSCAAAVGVMPLVLEGWRFDSATCNATGAVTTYKRTDNALVSRFVSAVRERHGNEPVIFDKGDSALVRSELKMQFGGDDALEASDVRLARLTSHLQSVRIKLDIEEKSKEDPARNRLPGQEANNTPPVPLPLWKSYRFSFQTELSPTETWAGLDTHGIRITELKTSLKDADSNPTLVWDTAGELYAQ